MDIKTGRKPPESKSKTPSTEKSLIKEIVNKLQISEESNDFAFTEVDCEGHHDRFKRAFCRYAEKFTEISGIAKEFKFEKTESGFNIWRVK